MTIAKSDFVARTHLLLARFDRDAPRALVPLLHPIRAEHDAIVALGAAAVRAEENLRRARRDARTVASELDVSVAKLADALVRAGIGDRVSPLSAIGAPSPTTLVRMSGLRKAEALRGVLALVARIDPPPPVEAAAADCERATSALVTALDERDHAEHTWVRALATRDAAHASLRTSLRKLERRAQVAWEDEPGTARSLFAILRPPRRKRRPGVDGSRADAVSAASGSGRAGVVEKPAEPCRVLGDSAGASASCTARSSVLFPASFGPTNA